MYYIRAHYPDDSIKLGNLDGQCAIKTSRPTSTAAWKNLGVIHRSARVAYWTLSDDRDNILAIKANPHFQETPNGTS